MQPASKTTSSASALAPTGGQIRITMNTPMSGMVAPDQTRIVLIHVGKCAGSSLIRAMRLALSDRYVAYEMHCYDANQIIRDTLASGDSDFVYVIAMRDPIARFVSAHNWDRHLIYFSGQVRPGHVANHFGEFTSADVQARALSAEDPATAARARALAGFGHMGMGQAWYTPPDVVEALPEGRTFLCETEHFARDMRRIAKLLDARNLTRNIWVSHENGDYQLGYENADALFPTGLSAQARHNLRVFLDDDFCVHQALRQRFAAF